MRIAYSCAGEGFGHAGRMVALYDDLKKYHEIVLYVPEPIKFFVASRLPQAVLRHIPCFTFVKQKNRVEYIRTHCCPVN